MLGSDDFQGIECLPKSSDRVSVTRTKQLRYWQNYSSSHPNRSLRGDSRTRQGGLSERAGGTDAQDCFASEAASSAH
jgi:hypothetical protein